MPLILSCLFAKWKSQNPPKYLRHLCTRVPWTCVTLSFPEMLLTFVGVEQEGFGYNVERNKQICSWYHLALPIPRQREATKSGSLQLGYFFFLRSSKLNLRLSLHPSTSTPLINLCTTGRRFLA